MAVRMYIGNHELASITKGEYSELQRKVNNLMLEVQKLKKAVNSKTNFYKENQKEFGKNFEKLTK